MRTLRRGCWGDDVREWQERLNDDGAVLEADGIFGRLTHTATLVWQRMHGLDADGKVGPLTRAAAGSVDPGRDTVPPVPATDDHRRDRIAATAALAIDLEAYPGSPTRDAMIALCQSPKGAPTWDWDRPFSVKARTGVSSCIIAQNGIYREAGCLVPSVVGPKIIGSGSELYAAGLKARCWVVPGPDRRPGVGDAIVLGSGLSTHVRTVLTWEGDVCVTVDGGQVDPAHGWLQCIREKRNRWGRVGGVWREVARAVVGWTDCAGLPWA